ncbi:MAG: DUF4143 domain-containing protein [Bacteroidia bacterium]|nr:DUF4143 domain-containing protein [Bacteroidia bacterium]
MHLIKPYSANTDRAIAVQPKMYLADTGLISQLAQVSSGALFENAIALQLMRLNTASLLAFSSIKCNFMSGILT